MTCDSKFLSRAVKSGLFFVVFAANAEIAQSPLFLTGAAKPNVMLMIDSSGSMDGKLPSNTTYDPTRTYLDGKCKSSNNTAMSTNKTYGTSVPQYFLGNGKYGKQCFDPTANYKNFDSVMSALLSAAGAKSKSEIANFLNWYYTDKLGQSRIEAAQTAAKSLVQSLSNVRIGLSTFNNTKGGKLLEVIDDLSQAKRDNLNAAIDGLSAGGYTPLAETLVDIGRYFATGYSGDLTLHPDSVGPKKEAVAVATALPSEFVDSTNWSGRTAISGEPSFSTPPIQYYCQKSFNIMLTDGLPTEDRNDIYPGNSDHPGGLSDYDVDCVGVNSGCTGSYDMKEAYAYPG